MKNKIITISGSLKFYEEMIHIAQELSMNGNIVLLPFKDPNENNMTDEAKKMHEEIHRQRIDMSDSLFVINKDGYIGKSTKNEILYALNTKKRDENKKPIVFMEHVQIKQWDDILSTIPVDSLISCISPTLQYMMGDLMNSIIKYQSLHEKDECNYAQDGIEIFRHQIFVRNLIESIEKILKPTDINFWKYCFDIKSNACVNVMKNACGDVSNFNNIVFLSTDNLIYFTPSEIIMHKYNKEED